MKCLERRAPPLPYDIRSPLVHGLRSANVASFRYKVTRAQERTLRKNLSNTDRVDRRELRR